MRILPIDFTNTFGQAPSFFGNGNEMNMIVHQAISPVNDARFLPLILEQLDVKTLIAVAEKYILPPIPSLDDVMWTIWNYDSRKSGHLVYSYTFKDDWQGTAFSRKPKTHRRGIIGGIK